MGKRCELYVHLVWATRERDPCLDAETRAWLWPLMGDEARARGCVWAVVGGVEDHVHVLAAMPTTMTVSDLVRHLKGWSTRAVRERGIGLRWQAGYAAFSVSPSGVPQVEAYIRGQEAHHANGSVEGSWEWND